jgi:hypothetical protein
MSREVFHAYIVQQGSSDTFEVSDENAWYVLRETWQGARLLDTRIVSKHLTREDALDEKRRLEPAMPTSAESEAEEALLEAEARMGELRELDREIRLLAERRAELGLEKEAALRTRDKVRASARVTAAERRAAQQESDVRDMACILAIAGNMHPHPAVTVEFDAEKVPAWRVVIAPDLSEWLTEPLTEPEDDESEALEE